MKNSYFQTMENIGFSVINIKVIFEKDRNLQQSE
jgi:hypothetical protein